VSTATLAEVRREAKQRKIPWVAVQAAADQVKAAERDKREHANEVRQTAWYYATALSPGCWPFWRHGFRSRWGRRVDDHDYTCIPGYDLLGQEVASAFPEYSTDDGTERLFDFLFSPYDKLPSAETVWRKALDLASYHHESQPQPDAIPF